MKKNIKMAGVIALGIVASVNIFPKASEIHFGKNSTFSTVELSNVKALSSGQSTAEVQDKTSKNVSDASKVDKVVATDVAVENRAVNTTTNNETRVSTTAKSSSSGVGGAVSSQSSSKPAPTTEEPAKAQVTSANVESAPATSVPEMDDKNKNNGSINIKYTNNTGKKMKVSIKKDCSNAYFDFKGNGTFESFPLQYGSGQYTVGLFLNDNGTKYTSVKTWTIQVNIGNANSVYLNSNQIVNFAGAPNAVSKAKSLVSGMTSDEDKIKAIYKFVVYNINYNSNKVDSVSSGYIPNIDSTYGSQSGICYDFSAIFAGMLRSVGVPTKLVMGTSSNVSGYHAWNEVYINGKWNIIDTSYDSQARKANIAFTMFKSAGSYSESKEY